MKYETCEEKVKMKKAWKYYVLKVDKIAITLALATATLQSGYN